MLHAQRVLVAAVCAEVRPAQSCKHSLRKTLHQVWKGQSLRLASSRSFSALPRARLSSFSCFWVSFRSS
eukprot:9138125-Pyramimonas_sp.AAC.1